MDSDYEVRQECCSWCTWRRSRFFAFLSAFIAITFIAIAAFVPHAIRTTIDDSIRDAVVLTPSSQHDNSDVWRTFASYKDPDSVPVSYSVNLWNVTNPAEVIRGEKPIVVEVGPYIFEEVKERLNATFETDLSGHKVVKYWERTYYILDTEKTSPELQLMNQNITNINFLFFGFAAQTAVLGNLGGYLVLTNFQKYCGESVVAGETIEQCAAFQTRTAYEWMFGYIDEKLAPLATPTNPVPFQFPGLVGNSTSNNIITMDNAQYMEMYTGEDLDELSRQYKVYNGTSSMMVPAIGGTTPTVYMWNTDIANRIYGTDGTQFRRNPPRGGSLPCWVSELNRVVTLVNENGLMIDNKGIQLQRYTLDSRTLLNISQVKENSAYYQDWVNGVLNVSAANQYVPIYMSRPNCLAVDQRICDKVIGFHPQTALHETYVDVEPMTGMTFHAAKRLQANLRFPRVLVTNNIFAQNETAWFTNVDSELLLPIFWVDESGEIPDDKAKDFKNSVYLFNDLAKYSQWAFYIVGNLFILLSLFLFNLALKRSASNKNLQHSEPFTAPSNYHAL